MQQHKEFFYEWKFDKHFTKKIHEFYNFSDEKDKHVFRLKKRIFETLVEIWKNIQEYSINWEWKIRAEIHHNFWIIEWENLINENQKKKLEDILHSFQQSTTNEQITEIKLNKFKYENRLNNCWVWLIETFMRSYPIWEREKQWDNSHNFNFEFKKTTEHSKHSIVYVFKIKTKIIA